MLSMNNNIQYVETQVVSCDGNANGSAHPLIYLAMGDKNEVVCPYCSRQFVLLDEQQARK
jgi:uncharacterized Zn-finger protein